MMREPTPRRQTQVVPVVPALVPDENAILWGKLGSGSRGSRDGSQNAGGGSQVPPIGGTGDQGPGTKRLWYPVNAVRHRLGNHRCGELIMAALDHWACATTVHLDPWPLSPAGEVEALRDGRRTYQIRQWGVRHRNAYRITGNPPRPGVTVLAEHRCGERIPETWKQPPTPATPKPNTTEVPY